MVAEFCALLEIAATAITTPVVAATKRHSDRRDTRIAPPFEEPQTPLERQLAEIACSLLELPRLGRNDNFFGVGGYSLAASQFAARIEADLRRKAPLPLIFEFPTIAELAASLEKQTLERPEGGHSRATGG
jgi:hypothetical protein